MLKKEISIELEEVDVRHGFGNTAITTLTLTLRECAKSEVSSQFVAL
jgi:hypothetical protein